jgi:predicted  nucleic acid-binding Zn-ribbon protein
MVSELEELKERHDALEAVVRELEHRLTMDEYQLNNVIQMGPPPAQSGDEGADGESASKRDTWLESVDSMIRSIGLHQGFHANHLKDAERELKDLRAQQKNLHEIAMVRIEGPLSAIREGVERIEQVITGLADRRTP